MLRGSPDAIAANTVPTTVDRAVPGAQPTQAAINR